MCTTETPDECKAGMEFCSVCFSGTGTGTCEDCGNTCDPYLGEVPGYVWLADDLSKPVADAEGKFDMPWGQADDVSKDLICKLPPSGWNEEWLPSPKPQPTTTKAEARTTPETEPDISLSVAKSVPVLLLLGLVLVKAA